MLTLTDTNRGNAATRGEFSKRVRIGDWVYDAIAGTLQNESSIRTLTPKCTRLLDQLILAAPDPISRDQLLELVWPEVMVSDHTLHELISQLRKHLGDQARAPYYIETVSKRGYRFIARIEQLSETRGNTRWLDGRSIQLVPAQTSSQGQHMDMTTLEQRLIDRLAGTPELRVHLPVAANPAGNASDYLVEANLLADSSQPSAQVRLTHSDGEVVWSERLVASTSTDDAADLLATHIVQKLRLHLIADWQCRRIRQRAGNADAAALACAATLMNYRVNQNGDFDPALMRDQAERAVSLDPDLLEVWQLLPSAYLWLRNSGAISPDKAAELIHAATSQAVQLGPDDLLTLFTLGFVKLQIDGDADEAEACLSKAIASEPLHPNVHWCHSMLGMVYRRRGDLNRAIDYHQRAVRVFDSDGRTLSEYAEVLAFTGRFQEALSVAEKALTLRPFELARSLAIGVGFRSLLATGGRQSAQAWLDHWLPTIEPSWQFSVGYALASLGREAEAQELLLSAEPDAIHYASYWLVLGWQALGDNKKAHSEARRAIAQNASTLMMRINVDPELRVIREEIRSPT